METDAELDRFLIDGALEPIHPRRATAQVRDVLDAFGFGAYD